MPFLKTAAISAALAIGLGAFGAHALHDRLLADGMLETWKTAGSYHLLHAVALFALASRPAQAIVGPLAAAGWLWTGGMVLFSGSLYGLALTGWAFLGPLTPIGGLSFIAGWLALLLPRASKR